MIDLIYTDRSEADGGTDFLAEDGGFGVPDVGIDEHTRNNTVSVEGLSISEMSVGLAGVGGGVVPI